MPPFYCSEQETVVRAVNKTNYDERKGTGSSSLFDVKEASVSRLAVLPKGEIVYIFEKTLHNPPDDPLCGLGLLLVKDIEDIGNPNQESKKPIRVLPQPQWAPLKPKWVGRTGNNGKIFNSSHAVLTGRLATRGMRRKLVRDYMKFESLDIK